VAVSVPSPAEHLASRDADPVALFRVDPGEMEGELVASGSSPGSKIRHEPLDAHPGPLSPGPLSSNTEQKEWGGRGRAIRKTLAASASRREANMLTRRAPRSARCVQPGARGSSSKCHRAGRSVATRSPWAR